MLHSKVVVESIELDIVEPLNEGINLQSSPILHRSAKT